MAPSGSGSKKARASARTASDRVSQMRKEQQKKDRQRMLAIWGAAAVTIAIIAGAVTFAVIQGNANKPDLSAVKSFDYPSGNHTTDPVAYKENPPVGGEHNPVWLNCGVYDSPVPKENAVHSLEHGAVWVTYRPDLPQADFDKLKSVIPDSYMVLSPYEGLPSPVVASAWGKQIQLTGANDNRLEAFIKEYRQGPQTPEPGALCTNGTDGTDDNATPQVPMSPSASPSASASATSSAPVSPSPTASK
ncbi:DUF3105 domain-containing protein [Knoellia subterranea]|uniref:DUF3105 domain-containing protein n=1 Tax=Knoellia subterranea KCTC 19937 TaxID=1385521 RepID=A0A0A0JMT5_9MICO|nr:DUF3105 domain-containing protein [Knoellia subterranea]KGN38014.1 hypothetical protein N803_09520 [Knoellia subterranea KCTC 19937]